MRVFLAAAGALATMAWPAAAQDTGLAATGGCASVPILRASIPVVEVRIGGKGPYRFAIDTGAQGHGRISTALAEELGLPKVGEVGTPAPGGTVATRPVFGAPEVSVGSVSFKNVDLVALSTVRGPEIEWDGILGNELIQLLPLTLDYGNGRARFGDVAVMEAPLAVSVTAGTSPLPIQTVGWPTPRAGGNLGSRGMAGLSVTFDASSQLARIERSGRSPTCPG